MSSLAKPTNPSSSSRFTNLTFLFVHLDFFVDAFNKGEKVDSIMDFSLVFKKLGLITRTGFLTSHSYSKKQL